ncbi:LysM peptidoglycan-binding domain-containing protein [Catellatospora tritici]|uniref:LysM peptidoglycan-binding domain-containing protein n=1 Tax=Catellatospora tritici TaxID=2851566 RepID=UPI001C2D4B04|nr:LysM domain-containing protein [Catellatospora tritici]MBV1850167.1 LysM peptidoglycan-binding domain-containing protein [Catellatospora tritici]
MPIKRWHNVRTGPTGDKIISIFEKYYPKKRDLYVSSGMDGDHGGSSHHYGLSHQGSPTAAVDFGVGAKSTIGRDLAKWIEDEFHDQCVELIHTTPFPDDDGFYVKNGQKISSYGAGTDAAHADHVHLAMSAVQADEVLARLERKYGDKVKGTRARRTTTAKKTTAKKAPAKKAAGAASKRYTVKAGDTLTAIANRFDTTVLELCRLNPQITDPDLIEIGWRLRIT